ncbi:MAG TPA: hypothetical protein ENI62_11680 [Gammaproteobacteria bacterium]|nr:hypothetical protein [Gammaproteobacteria bacterium]
MSTGRHAGLTFSGNEATLAVPYHIHGPVADIDKKCEIFLHIPKCGGTTLHFIMACCAEFTRKSYTRYVIRDVNPPVLMRDGWTGAWDEVFHAKITSENSPLYISGHFPFGVHANIDVPCHYITLVRDPVAREISNFNHHYQKGFLDGDASLLKQMVQERIIIDNPQTRMLAGVGAMTGVCSEETWGLAVENLASCFSIIGTVENSSEVIRGVLALNGWPAIAYVRAQISAVKAIKSVNSELSGMLYDYHSYDRRLHECATEKWNEWKSLYVQGERKLDPDEPVICLPPDIHERKQPILIKGSQLSMLFG